MARSIFEPWEVSQDRPSPYEPVKFVETNITPFDTNREYLKYITHAIRRGKPIQALHDYDEYHRMPGHFTNAEIISGELWVTFTPEKLGGKFWVSFAPWHK